MVPACAHGLKQKEYLYYEIRWATAGLNSCSSHSSFASCMFLRSRVNAPMCLPEIDNVTDLALKDIPSASSKRANVPQPGAVFLLIGKRQIDVLVVLDRLLKHPALVNSVHPPRAIAPSFPYLSRIYRELRSSSPDSRVRVRVVLVLVVEFSFSHGSRTRWMAKEEKLGEEGKKKRSMSEEYRVTKRCV